MLQIAPRMRILVAVEAVDFRKGIDSLAELCRAKLNADPFSGCLFVFRSAASVIAGPIKKQRPGLYQLIGGVVVISESMFLATAFALHG
jgi:hypothetical protein